MFDIGLFELLVVGGVGLVVIGPERLPGAIRTGALWIGRIKRSVLETRREIEQSIGADEIRRELRNEEIMASLEKLKEARAQLEQDIKQHASGNTLEHHHDNEAKPPLDEHHHEHSDDHAHHQHAHGEHTADDQQSLHQSHNHDEPHSAAEGNSEVTPDKDPSTAPAADDNPTKQ